MHVIAEQQLDQTANLAVLPPSKGLLKRSCQPDFINTQVSLLGRHFVISLFCLVI
jgi:hypothetical protein